MEGNALTVVAGGRSIVGIGMVLTLALTGCSGGSGGASAPHAPTTLATPTSTTTATSPVPSVTAPTATTPATPAPKPKPAPAQSTGLASYTPTGPLVADSGFRPERDGFLFENYGQQLADGSLPTNLTVDDVRKMFSDAVCVAGGGPTCVLIPEAQQWLTSTNSQMASGHCYGFAVTAELFWAHKSNPAAFGASTTQALSILKNPVLQRNIAYSWAEQLLPATQRAAVSGPPNLMLHRLETALVPNPSETFTIGLTRRNGTGGHAVTPYAVEDGGSGKFNVLIYDNNTPTVTQAISFDTNANSWQYVAQVSPRVKPSSYDGDANSQNLFLYPSSPGQGTQPCPFCNRQPSARPVGLGSAGTAASTSTSTSPASDLTAEIFLDGGEHHGHLLITDDAGHRLGYVHGTLVNEIPGATVSQVIVQNDAQRNREPRFIVPANARYRIVADASGLKEPDKETFGIIGPTYAISAENITMNPGDKGTLIRDRTAGTFSYTTSRPKQWTVKIGASDQDAHYTIRLRGMSDPLHQTVRLGLPLETRTLSIDRPGPPGGAPMDLTLTRQTLSENIVFSHSGIVPRSDAAVLPYAEWTRPSLGIPMTTTKDGKRSTTVLANEAI